MSDTAPILLRPSAALAAAMTAAAEARGISRQAWMLTVLEGACSEYMTAVTPDDVPLFDAPASGKFAAISRTPGTTPVDYRGRGA